MADGNGRISRFLINDTLRRDEAVPAPLLLPAYSRPMMAEAVNDIHFGDRTIYPDGVVSDFAAKPIRHQYDANAAMEELTEGGGMLP